MDTARDGAGRLVEHANRQSCCLQLDSGRSLDQIIVDFSRPPTLFLSMVRERRYYEDVGAVLVKLRLYVLFCFSVACEGLYHGYVFGVVWRSQWCWTIRCRSRPIIRIVEPRQWREGDVFMSKDMWV